MGFDRQSDFVAANRDVGGDFLAKQVNGNGADGCLCQLQYHGAVLAAGLIEPDADGAVLFCGQNGGYNGTY